MSLIATALAGSGMVAVLEKTDGQSGLVALVGVPGPPGPSGGLGYTHTQSLAAVVWTVAHNLNRFPSATVVDHLGNEIYGDVTHLSNTLLQVTHGAALTGAVYCN